MFTSCTWFEIDFTVSHSQLQFSWKLYCGNVSRMFYLKGNTIKYPEILADFFISFNLKVWSQQTVTLLSRCDHTWGSSNLWSQILSSVIIPRCILLHFPGQHFLPFRYTSKFLKTARFSLHMLQWLVLSRGKSRGYWNVLYSFSNHKVQNESYTVVKVD